MREWGVHRQDVVGVCDACAWRLRKHRETRNLLVGFLSLRNHARGPTPQLLTFYLGMHLRAILLRLPPLRYYTASASRA